MLRNTRDVPSRNLFLFISHTGVGRGGAHLTVENMIRGVIVIKKFYSVSKHLPPLGIIQKSNDFTIMLFAIISLLFLNNKLNSSRRIITYYSYLVHLDKMQKSGTKSDSHSIWMKLSKIKMGL